MTQREAFEKWARDMFVCGDYSFVRAHPFGYINTVQSETFGGRTQPCYADVQMLWLTWQACASEHAELLRKAVEALEKCRAGLQTARAVREDGTSHEISPRVVTDALAAIAAFQGEINE